MGRFSSQISIAMPQTSRVGNLSESLSLIHYIAVDLLQKLCSDEATDRTWADKVLGTMNLCVVDLEAQGLENFPEWLEN